MSFLKVDNVSILGMACAVPKHTSTISNPKFSSTTGVYERRLVDDICTSDLCEAAANQLISDMSINRNEIDILVFISQTSDYKLPITSTILQYKLNLSQSCMCFDVPLGCSGYVYGLSIISSLINTGKIKKGLLLVGDTISKEVDKDDQSTEPLFGDAGSATILEYDDSSNSMLFDLGSDGSGYESIIIRGGGSRDRLSSNRLALSGVDVFNFGIRKIPKVVDDFLFNFKLDKNDIDLFVFHQANKFMNDRIYKKLNIPEHKTISSLYRFGNTSSATIPLTIVTEKGLIEKNNKLVLCGFGVGLSWGTAYISLNKNIFCSKLVEI